MVKSKPTVERLGSGLWVILGVLLGLTYVALVGILSIQASAARDGAEINLNNEVVGVRNPSSPIIEWVALALLGVLVFFVFVEWAIRWPRAMRVSGAAGFVISALALCIWAVLREGDDVPGTASALTEEGWRGWVQHGGVNPATHLLIALIGVSVLREAIRWRERVSATSA